MNNLYKCNTCGSGHITLATNEKGITLKKIFKDEEAEKVYKTMFNLNGDYLGGGMFIDNAQFDWFYKGFQLKIKIITKEKAQIAFCGSGENKIKILRPFFKLEEASEEVKDFIFNTEWEV